MLYLLHLLGMAASLYPPDGKGQGKGKQGEANDEPDAIVEHISSLGIEAQL